MEIGIPLHTIPNHLVPPSATIKFMIGNSIQSSGVFTIGNIMSMGHLTKR